MAHIYQRGETWWIKYFVHGKPVFRSLKTTKKKDADRLKIAIEAQLQTNPDGLRTTDIPVEVFWPKYLEWAEIHKRPSTIAGEKIFWKQFIDFAQPRTLKDVTKADVERFKAKRLLDKIKPISINDAIKHLQAIFGHALRLGYYRGENPFVGVERFKIPKRPPKYLQIEEITKLMNRAREAGKNMYIIFALGIFAGFRKNEIANARWEWFDFKKRIITLRGYQRVVLKDRDSRTVPLSKQLAEILQPYREDEGFLLVSDRHSEGRYAYRYDFKNAFKKLVEQAGLKWVS